MITNKTQALDAMADELSRRDAIERSIQETMMGEFKEESEFLYNYQPGSMTFNVLYLDGYDGVALAPDVPFANINKKPRNWHGGEPVQYIKLDYEDTLQASEKQKGDWFGTPQKAVDNENDKIRNRGKGPKPVEIAL